MKIEIEVRPTENPGEWEVLKELEWRGIPVPEGFIFDGASIPWALQPFVKKGGKVFAPGCIHDFLYRSAKGDRKACDLVLYEALLSNEVGPRKAKTMYLGVRAGGWVAWRKNQKANTRKRIA